MDISSVLIDVGVFAAVMLGVTFLIFLLTD